MRKVSPLGEFKSQLEPLIEGNIYEISEQDLEYLSNRLKKWYKKQDGTFELVNNATQAEFEEYEKEKLRGKRYPLLHAWDILLNNVNFGAETLSEQERQELITWKQQILDLNEEAINNPPAKILRYLN